MIFFTLKKHSFEYSFWGSLGSFTMGLLVCPLTLIFIIHLLINIFTIILFLGVSDKIITIFIYIYRRQGASLSFLIDHSIKKTSKLSFFPIQEYSRFINRNFLAVNRLIHITKIKRTFNKPYFRILPYFLYFVYIH